MSNSECKSNNQIGAKAWEGLIDVVTQLAYKVLALESIVAQRSAETLADIQALTSRLDCMEQDNAALLRRLYTLETEKGQHSNKLLITVKVEPDAADNGDR